MRKLSLSIAGAVLAASTTTAGAADMSYALRARVAVHCQVHQQAPGDGEVVRDQAVSLGRFREYCNAPGGYELVVRYAPGSLDGAVLTAGEDRVMLDGSGETTLSRATGPRIREMAVAATPGPRGFDTDRLELLLVPAPAGN